MSSVVKTFFTLAVVVIVLCAFTQARQCSIKPCHMVNDIIDNFIINCSDDLLIKIEEIRIENSTFSKYLEKSTNDAQRFCHFQKMCIITPQEIDSCNNVTFSDMILEQGKWFNLTYRCVKQEPLSYWTNWSEWSVCSLDSQLRTRECQVPPIKVCTYQGCSNDNMGPSSEVISCNSTKYFALPTSTQQISSLQSALYKHDISSPTSLFTLISTQMLNSSQPFQHNVSFSTIQLYSSSSVFFEHNKKYSHTFHTSYNIDLTTRVLSSLVSQSEPSLFTVLQYDSSSIVLTNLVKVMNSSVTPYKSLGNSTKHFFLPTSTQQLSSSLSALYKHDISSTVQVLLPTSNILLKSSSSVLFQNDDNYMPFSTIQLYSSSLVFFEHNKKYNYTFHTSYNIDLTTRVLSSLVSQSEPSLSTALQYDSSSIVLSNPVKVINSSVTPYKSLDIFCEEDTEGDENFKGQFYFTKTQIHKTVSLKCPYGALKGFHSTNITRKCMFDGLSARWSLLDITNCASKSIETSNLLLMLQENITSENLQNKTLNLLNKIEEFNMTLSSYDVGIIADILKKSIAVNSTNDEANKGMLKCVDLILSMNNSSVLNEETSASLRNVITQIAEASLSVNSSLTYSGSNMALSTYFSESSTDVFMSVSEEEGKKVILVNSKNEMEAVPNALCKVRLPQSFISKNSHLKLYFVTYSSGDFFYSKVNNGIAANLASVVISINVIDRIIKDMNTSFEMRFSVTHKDNQYLSCRYWEEKSNTSDGFWSGRGCNSKVIVNPSSEKEVMCVCNHLTSFAVLLDIDATHSYSSVELSLITFIGCIVSAAALVMTLATYALFRNLRRKMPQKILINLCLSMLFLVITFLIGIKRTSNSRFCHIVSSLLHYFTLTTFGWMVVECVFLYKSVVIVLQFRQDLKLFWTICVLTWGFPAIVSGATSYFTKDLFDGFNNYCVVTGSTFLITTIIPISCAMLFNLSLFVPIIRGIQNHLSLKKKFQSKEDLLARVRTTISCVILLGLTWVFGLLAVGDLRVPLQWTFSILNSFQGLFIFFFHTIKNEEVQREWLRILCRKKYPSVSLSTSTLSILISKETKM